MKKSIDSSDFPMQNFKASVVNKTRQGPFTAKLVTSLGNKELENISGDEVVLLRPPSV